MNNIRFKILDKININSIFNIHYTNYTLLNKILILDIKVKNMKTYLDVRIFVDNYIQYNFDGVLKD